MQLCLSLLSKLLNSLEVSADGVFAPGAGVHAAGPPAFDVLSANEENQQQNS